jgi:hypothetical protein
MNLEYEKQLEAAIDRELKDLPELTAPPSLALRVINALEQRARAPWYRQSWQTWPAALQAAAMAVLLAFFGALCFAGWRLPQFETVSAASRALGAACSAVGIVWKGLTLVLAALASAVLRLGPGLLVAWLVAAVLAYAACIALGTWYVRLGLAPQKSKGSL